MKICLANDYIKELSISEKVGQVVMPRLDFRNSDPLPDAKEHVRKFHVGGFIVFGGECDQVKAATRELQALSRIPLLFACDSERGVGQIVSGTVRFPFTMSLGAIGDEELVYRQAKFIAEEMKDCGMNLIFAPVVDVNTNPDNPIINIRAYGDDPNLVSRLGAAFIKGAQDNGVLACAKHFPGHGSVAVDSHVHLPSSDQTREDFDKCDLIPFKGAIESGVASIMIAHLAAPKIDPSGLPATVSPKIMRDLLTNDLGFEGLIITDSFIMEAIAELGKEEGSASHSILAGSDIILDPKEPAKLLQRLSEMVNGGEIPLQILDTAVEKIISIKNNWMPSSTNKDTSDKKHGERLLNEIARRSVCLLKGGNLESNKVMIYVLDVTEADGDISKPFAEQLSEAGIDCEKKSLIVQDIEIPVPISDDRAVICLLYTSVTAWKGHSKLPHAFKEFLERVSNLHSEKILISFGSPYTVRGFESFDTILCSFDHLSACQEATADVLLGRMAALGELPVKL